MKKIIKSITKKKVLITILILIIITISIIYAINKNKIYFFPNEISSQYSNSLNCTLTHTNGVYNMSTKVNPKNEIEISNFKKDKNTIKFKFDNLNQNTVKVSIGDSLSITDGIALKVGETDTAIHLIGYWGSNQQDIVTYSIYKKTGFITYTRSGDMLLLGESLMSGFGRCY